MNKQPRQTSFKLKQLLLVPILLSTGCRDPGLQRSEFEDRWWQTDKYDLCINLHRLGADTASEHQTLIYDEGKISNIGEWVFVDPNRYYLEDNFLTVEEHDTCWDVALHYGIDLAGVMEDVVCECTMKEDAQSE